MSKEREYIDPNWLTPSEREIISLLVAGNTTRAALAKARYTSSRTISAQLSTIYSKLGFKTIACLFYWALHNGWSLDGVYQMPVETRIAGIANQLQVMTDELRKLSKQDKQPDVQNV